MNAPTRQFREYLAADEAVVAVGSGTLLDSSRREPVSIGLTDRRLLSVAGDGGFLDVEYRTISSIRSRPRRPLTYRGNDYRLVAAAGVLLAVPALLGAVVLAAGWPAHVLAVAFLGSLAAAVYVDRSDFRVAWPALADAVASFYDGTDEPHRLRRHEQRVVRRAERIADRVGRERLLVALVTLLAVLSFVGLLAVAANALVAPLLVVAAAGLALVDYAYRHRSDLDGIDLVRRDQRELDIHLGDGRTVSLRFDAEETIDRELSRLTSARDPETVAPSSPSS